MIEVVYLEFVVCMCLLENKDYRKCYFGKGYKFVKKLI